MNIFLLKKISVNEMKSKGEASGNSQNDNLRL